MSTPLNPTMLEVGLDAIWREQEAGFEAKIAYVALGDAGYAPDQGQQGLRSERVRFPVAGGKKLSSRQLHVTALGDHGPEFWVKEVGFVLENGVFLAVYSDPNRVLQYFKPDTAAHILAYDVLLSSIPADSVTIVTGPINLNLSMAEEYAAIANAMVGLQRIVIKPYLQ